MSFFHFHTAILPANNFLVYKANRPLSFARSTVDLDHIVHSVLAALLLTQGGSVKSSHVAAAMIFTLMICRPAASQNVPALADLESAAISDAKAPDLAFPEPFQQPIPQPPPPAEPELIQADTSWREYRTTIESFEERRHRFVHCKLKNGKVLTGLIRGIGRDGFSLHPNALGGPRI